MDWFAPYRPMPVDDLPPPALKQVVGRSALDRTEEGAEVRVAEMHRPASVEPVVVLAGEGAAVAPAADDEDASLAAPVHVKPWRASSRGR